MYRTPPEPARDGAFSALALLRCRDRLGQILGAVAEPRRSELENALASFAAFDEIRLKDVLAQLIRHEVRAQTDAAARALGAAAPRAPRALQRWLICSSRP